MESNEALLRIYDFMRLTRAMEDRTRTLFFFFFQAEDGIRAGRVTGVSDVCSSDLGTVASAPTTVPCPPPGGMPALTPRRRGAAEDRKSTRLNSSHPSNSYAVLCLK